MKSARIILLSLLIAIGGVFFLICKHTYEEKLTKITQKAKEAFTEALRQEFASRELKGPLTIFLDLKKAKEKVIIPSYASIEDSLGKYSLEFTPDMHYKNITQDSGMRFLHTITFSKKPLHPDSLNTKWNQQLSKVGIATPSALCISVTGRNKKITSAQTQHSAWLSSFNQIFTIYIGYGCEIKVLGHLNYSLWHIVGFKFILCLLLLHIICIYILYRAITSIWNKITAPREKEIVEVFVIKEVEVSVVKIAQEVAGTPIRSYILREQIIFYAEQKIIEKKGVEHKIPAQACRLLELFLKEKENGYTLTDASIAENLWTDEAINTNARIHQAITRLRRELQKIDVSINILRGAETYQLIL